MSKISEVITTFPDKNTTFQDHFAEIYRQIGVYFINNAERLGNNVVDNVSEIDIFIGLRPSEVVTIDITQKELLMKQGLTANATIGKLQVEPDLNRIVEKFGEKLESMAEGMKDE